MMKERSWIVSSVMSVMASMEKSTACGFSDMSHDVVVIVSLPAPRIDRPSR